MKNLNFDMIPLNNDTFSLELPRSLDVLEKRHNIVNSLLKISNICGKFTNCIGLGAESKVITTLFRKYLKD